MGIGFSVLLIALGAIGVWAVDGNAVEGIDIDAIGIILMIAGAVGLLWAIVVAGTADERRSGVVRD